jgi:WD40 repeat protein
VARLEATMQRRFLLLGSLCSVLAVCGYACSSGDSTTSAGSTASTGTGTSSGSASTASGGDLDASDEGLFADHGALVALEITPPSAVIDIVNGVVAPTTFTAVATFADKFKSDVAADWLLDRVDLGVLDKASGVFTPHGTLGGKGVITATFNGQKATAQLSVVLHVSQNPGGLTPTEQTLFDAPDTTASGALLYPYDKTVFARGLLPPAMMWSGGATGDKYLVHVKEGFVDAKFFLTDDPLTQTFTLPESVWRFLTDSNAGEDVQVDILRASGGAAHAAMHESWTIAPGSLKGSIYYWAVNTGQLMKIAPGAATPTVVFDSGPADQLGTPAPANYQGQPGPWESGGNNKRCVACHAVSKDGSTIASIFEKKGSTASPWGTIDLTTSPPSVVQVTPYDSQAIYLGLTPDGKYAAENDANLTMHLVDTKTGTPLPGTLDAMADKVADPAFSPDGKHFAFSSNVIGSYPVEFTQADLDVFDFDQATLAFTNRRQIVKGAGEAIAFSSFSPDSSWLFFQKGDYSRAKYGANQFGHDDLFLADLAGQVGTLPLAIASGAGLDAKNQHLAYQPTVNPISVGGYTWVVFVSPRDYGHKMLSTSSPTYENRKQLWVAAIDANPQPGKDPSHPAFWLPGQDLATTNMSGYWALDACQQQGTECSQGYECCTGFCQPDASGKYACVTTPGGGCSSVGEKCATSADCCGKPAVQCVGGFCAQGQPN